MRRYPSHTSYLRRLISAPRLALVSFYAAAVTSSALTMAWDPNAESNVVGYKVYYGPSTRAYSGSVNVGKATQFSLDDLAPGHWFIAVTALTNAGDESDFSEELEIDLAPRKNSSPWLQGLPNQKTVNKDSGYSALLFSVGDAETPPEKLWAFAESSDPSLLDAQIVTAGGSPSLRGLMFRPKPNAIGMCRVSVTVSDGALSSSRIFQVYILSSGNECLSDQLPPFPALQTWAEAEKTSTLTSVICGSSIDVTAAGPATPVYYTPPVFLDLCDPHPVVRCVPPPGSSFPIGETTVVCSATDVSGNSSQCAFALNVQPAPDPSLNIQLLGSAASAIELSWPWSASQSFELEASEDISVVGKPLSWVKVQATVQVTDGRCKVILPAGGSGHFFRLVKSPEE
jgi:hypothetical protein